MVFRGEWGQQCVEVDSFEYGVEFLVYHKDFWNAAGQTYSCCPIFAGVTNFRLWRNFLIKIANSQKQEQAFRVDDKIEICWNGSPVQVGEKYVFHENNP